MRQNYETDPFDLVVSLACKEILPIHFCKKNLQVFNSVKAEGQIPNYEKFLQRYKGNQDNERMKCALTDIAFALMQLVWNELPVESRGECTFCIGGINAVSPFSATSVKNEILCYVNHIPQDSPHISPERHDHYNMRGEKISPLDLSKYEEIYMDFNGSMAFFEETWKHKLSDPMITKKVPHPS